MPLRAVSSQLEMFDENCYILVTMALFLTHLALSLGGEVLLEPLVLLLRGVVGGEEEGDGIPNDSLVMEGGGAGLTHRSQ